MASGPYTCNDMLVKIDDSTIGVVTGLDIRLSRENAGIQHVYGSDEGYHVYGGKRGTFTIQRWYYTDTDTDLIFDLFNDELPFTLSGEIDSVNNTKVTLSNCRAYTWRWITGDANSAVGEEATGEAVSWTTELT